MYVIRIKLKDMLLERDLGKLYSLPMVESLETGRHVIIDAMTDKQLAETYDMIQDAAAHGSGFGIDEFINEKNFRQEIHDSHCFAIICKESCDLIGGIILANSKFYRGASTMVDPFIIIKRTERGQRLGEFAMKTAIQFSQQLGYVGMYVDTFSNNTGMLKILQKIGGFTQVGFLPVGGRLQSGKLIGSIIFYRDLAEVSCDMENLSEYGADELADISEDDNLENINPVDLNLT
ncbi:Hypothetical predicted protein [Mytilus galloprovincialis]|uniref:N-acetyltransferase domain-containing protein n=3 Tax=Mytilus TaxID=6548 RepID=A0A8B6EA28_MYTGA|nr:Hypothetical predicted protein [Mytilus galloprovincialis]